MSESSTSANASAPENPEILALDKRLEASQGELELLRRNIRRSSLFSTIVGVLLLLLLTGYFTYGYVKIAAFLDEPEQFISLVAQTAEDYLPKGRKDLEATITESAPEWAERASEELVARAPDVRKALEDSILVQTDLLVQELSGFTEKEFHDFLINQRPTLETSIREWSSGEEVPEETIAVLQEALDKELQANTQQQADVLLHTLYALKDKLKKLAEGRYLNGEESLERQAMMIIRRLHLEQANPSFKGKALETGPKKPVEPQIGQDAGKPDDEPPSEAKEEAETPAPEAKEEAKAKAETPAPEAKEEAKPKAETPAPEAKEEAKPKAETPAPEAKEKPKPKAETPAPEAKPDDEKADEPESKPEPKKE